jgi:Holliday junction resolvasome RuvABC endonuclease subunit
VTGERTIVAVDPGLATFGLVGVRTDGTNHRCIRAAVFTSDPYARKHGVETSDDRARRARELSRWLDGEFTTLQPHVVAAESMSFPRGTHSIACICLGWGVLCDQLENRRLPMVASLPNVWRKAICGVPNEKRAHAQAVRTVPTFVDRARGIPRDLQEHALDALGVAVWSFSTNIVRAVVG